VLTKFVQAGVGILVSTQLENCVDECILTGSNKAVHVVVEATVGV